MGRFYLLFLSILTVFSASNSHGQSLYFKCNQPQTICEFEDKQLLMGDQVIILDGYDQIVAIAEVIGMTEKKRRVKITQRFATILADHRIKPLYEETLEQAMSKYRTAKNEQQRIGGNIGFLRLNLDTDSVAYNFQMHYDFPWRNKISFHGRASFFTLSGETSDGFGEQSGVAYSLSAFAFSGGLSYSILPNATLSFKPSAGLSMYYAMPSDESLIPLERAGSGFEFGYFTSVHVRYNGGNLNFTPYGFVEFVGIGGDASGVGLGVGFDMGLEKGLF
jgi:hypothetical protein